MYEIIKEGSVTSVRIEFDIDSEKNVGMMIEGLDEALKQSPGPIMVDLSSARIVNTYGVGQLLAYRKKFKEQGRDLRVRLGKGFIRDVFDTMLLSKLFDAEVPPEPVPEPPAPPAD